MDASWIGWFRKSGSRTWQQMVEGDSYHEAARLLLYAATTSGDLAVLPAGRHPSETESRPRRTSSTAAPNLSCSRKQAERSRA